MASWITSPTGPMTTHFWGPIANWGLSLSAIYDANMKGPEIINERMSATQVVYSALFMRFAWCVEPRNYILFSCHTANVMAQSNQLRRWGEYKLQQEPETAPAELKNLSMLGAGAAGVLATSLLIRKPVQSAMTSMGGPFAKIATAPAGPFYIHFWAPNFKWALSVNNLLDYDRPTDKISLSMTAALTATGTIFMRWSFVITPVNYSLFFVNLVLSTSSGYHLARKIKADYFSDK
eukprot:CAMPEP_0206487530 /NCGR_PEP_ID=MMETSP0324_2-20121206/41700_1 /ASSEMBLY_ACC=CAM_ASM_000836 /TAXON_ID=2866 /ORGANISM="Crypthecodinium cohnii, Strain Seligo" /LENGTH=234 /DNA_ID=CAMNT_0053966037 /DNA_START=85 /DNA_END=789 /DNA_ORIENTATION=-